jgi:hypothetical protein
MADSSFKPAEIWEPGMAVCIKRAEKRLVFRAGNYYVKAFKTGGVIMSKLRDPARKEFEIARRLYECGELTARPAGYASCGQWSYFAQASAPGMDMRQFLELHWPGMSGSLKTEICRRFALFLTRLAQAGLYQPDFHLDNILIHPQSWKFTIIDLHRASATDSPIDGMTRFRQLSYVLPPFAEALSLMDIMKCTSFLSKLWKELEHREVRHQVVQKAFSHMRHHWDKRGLRKITGSWNVQKSGSATMISSDSCPLEATNLLASFMHSPEAMISGAETLKNSKHTLCLDIVTGHGRYFLKAYRSSGHLKSVSYLLRPRKALRIWRLSWLIKLRHLPVMTPLAVIQHWNPWHRFYGALIYEWDRDAAAQPWKDKISHCLNRHQASGALVRRLAMEIWNMHQRGVFHGDCKITNFMTDLSGRITGFFDIDSTCLMQQVSDRQRMADIVCMAASLHKLLVKEHTAEGVTDILLSEYIRIHLPWEKRRDIVKGKLNSMLQEKITKSRNRGVHFSRT